MAKLSRKGLLGIAILLSLATAIMVYNYLKGLSTLAEGKTAPVMVAKVNIPPKTRITADMVQEIKVPENYIQPGAVMGTHKVVGVIARDHIVAGEQITQRRLFTEGKAVGLAGLIPQGKRAVTAAVNDIVGVAGFVKPGDFVDVIVIFDQNAAGDNVSNMILQNVLVLAANKETDSAGPDSSGKDRKDALKAGTVTLALTPQEAAQLSLAEEKGKIRLALRPFMPTNDVEMTKAVTPRELVGLPPVEKTAASDRSNTKPAQDNGKTGKESAGAGNGYGPGIQMIRGTKLETIPVN